MAEEAIGTFIDYRVGFCNIDQPEYTRAMPPTALLTSAGFPRESFTHAIATHYEGVGMLAWRNDDGSWERLKVCADHGCRWAFYDRSKNRQGHWCDMAVCGNRLKNRELRARQRDQSRTPGPAAARVKRSA